MCPLGKGGGGGKAETGPEARKEPKNGASVMSAERHSEMNDKEEKTD